MIQAAPPVPRRLAFIVGATAGTGLMLELLLARLMPFMLGDISAFVAIPIAMFGLSLGALWLHWRPDEPRAESLPGLSLALAGSVFVGLVVLFGLFNEVFNLVHHNAHNPRDHALRTVALTSVFLPAFAVVGVILSTAFAVGAKQIGRLYAVDLVGSAGACLATPFLLRLVGMEASLVGLVGLALTVVVAAWPGRRALLVSAAVFGLSAGGAATGTLFTAEPDPNLLGYRFAKGRTAREVAHVWNDISRVGFVEYFHEDRPGGRMRMLIHDDGISNVNVRQWKPERVREGGRILPSVPQTLPWLLDTPPKSALVMFAGCGMDMMRLLETAKGDLDVHGVELNPAIRSLVDGPHAGRWNQEEFLALPNVHLHLEEGRGYLSSDERRYDLIFVASNGARYSARTGHSRKFLDTHEAMLEYFEHLTPGGMVLFNMQDIDLKLESWKRIFEAAGVDFQRSVILSGRKGEVRRWARLLVKPSGFSDAEVARFRELWPPAAKRGDETVRYAPGFAPDPATERVMSAPPDPDRFVPSDDLPYPRRVDLAGWTPTPEPRRFSQRLYAMSWVKVFTLLVFTGLSLVVLGLFAGRRRGGLRLPVGWGAWFGVSGIAYMLVQVGLMGKLDLFLGSPLAAIALVLAAFLLANGAGSAWYGRREDSESAPPPWALAVAAGIGAPATLALLEALLGPTIGLPTAAKVVIAFAAVAPIAFVLGTFYPAGVIANVSRGRDALVPMTFGLATLSSVVGSTFAMVVVINVGFRALILGASVLYAVLALGAAMATRRS